MRVEIKAAMFVFAAMAAQAQPFARWAAVNNGAIPINAFVGGFSGAPESICRGTYQGGTHPGRTAPGLNACLIEYGGVQVSLPAFEVLVDFGGAWVRATNGSVPAGSFQTGVEGGQPFYSCRAYVEGGMKLGKVRAAIGACNIGHQGRAILARDYEVVRDVWVVGRNGSVPPNALRAGNEANGTPLYICRGAFGGGIHMGKINTNFAEGCRAAFNDQPAVMATYEVLTNDVTPLWQAGSNVVPPGAFHTGFDGNAGLFYSCRGNYQGGVHLGKTGGANTGFCRVEFGNAGVALTVYEVLSVQPNELSGTYRIRTKATGRFWTEAAASDKLISTRTQTDDAFARFTMQRQANGSYRIVAAGSGRHLHLDASSDNFLSTRFQPDDAFTRFVLQQEADGGHRIRLVANNTHMHEHGDGDRIISARFQNFNDDFSRFFFEPATAAAPVPVTVPLPANAVKCADEGGTCTIPAGRTGTVYYGATGAFLSKANVANSVACTNEAFGQDPVPNTLKACFVVLDGGGVVAPVLSAQPSSLTFNYQIGGAAPNGQQVQLQVTPAALTTFTARSDSAFVTVSPGTTQTGLFVVSVNTTGLSAGQVLQGSIIVSAAGATDLRVPVALNVTGSQVNNVSVSPAALVFSHRIGSPAPAPQVITIPGLGSGIGGTLRTYSVDFPSVAWLSVNPAGGAAPAPGGAQVTVSILPASLTVGIQSTTLRIRFPNDGNAVTEIPVSINVTDGGQQGGSNTSQVLSHIADSQGWQTTIILMNVDTEPAPFSLRFFGSQATGRSPSAPLDMAFTGLPGRTSIVEGVIPPGGSRTIQTAGTDGFLNMGWVELTTSKKIVGSSVFRDVNGRQEAAVGLTSSVRAFVLPFDNTQGRVTSFALINTNPTQTVTVNAVARDENGTVLGTASIPLLARGHTATETTGQFPGSASQRGTVEFTTAGADITGLGIRFDAAVPGAPRPFTSFPVQPK